VLCRRHGIQRWPRCQMAKVSMAMNEMERKQEFHVPAPAQDESAAVPPAACLQ
jgi:hypothetical protein